MYTLRRASGWIVATSLIASGCGGAEDDLPREPISGAVTLDGVPLKSGSIQFFPVSEADGIASGGTITDGRYEVPREQGPIPGGYSVMIFAQGEGKGGLDLGSAEPAADEMPGEITAKPAPRTGMIPARYNMETQLKAEVKAGGPNTFDFSLSKK